MPKRKTLKQKVHTYISKKQDVCCEEDVDRALIVEQIISKYKFVSRLMNQPGEYLSYVNNDIVKLIGYKYQMVKNGDKEGAHLWDEMDKRMYVNKAISEQKIKKLLLDVPLYFLLSLLGYASYRADELKLANYTK